MISTKNFNKMASSLMLLAIILGVTITYAVAEDNYQNDNNFLTNISENTFTENGYKANIIINPSVAGIYSTENGYKLDLTINPNGIGGSLKEGNYRIDLIPEKTFPDTPDIAVTQIAISRTVIAQGYTTQINITITNHAFNYETFTLIIKANTTTIKTQTTTLTSMSSSIITFTWNTTGYAKGNYTITGITWPVLGETDTADNNCNDGWILVVKVGDFGGGTPAKFFQFDGKVDGKDKALFLLCYRGVAPPEAMYLGDLGGGTPAQFFICDGKVDGKDKALFLLCYKGQGPPDP
jgi:hypothetical protein